MLRNGIALSVAQDMDATLSMGIYCARWPKLTA
jgi:hypothetical protein